MRGGRSNGSLAETTLHIAAKLPWWLGVALAVGIHFLLHAYVSRETAPHLWKAIASVLQYLLPALLLIAAMLSVIGRKRRQSLFANATQSKSSNAAEITWPQFQQLIGEAFRQQGYA